jgi:hypothetical protein
MSALQPLHFGDCRFISCRTPLHALVVFIGTLLASSSVNGANGVVRLRHNGNKKPSNHMLAVVLAPGPQAGVMSWAVLLQLCC